MNRSTALAVAGVLLAISACNPFRSPFKQDPVVSVSDGDIHANTRWSGTLESPANLAGAVHMKGSATMTPGSNGQNTRVMVNLSNASPGGVHPWQVRRGRCGSDEGVLGRAEEYKALKVDDYGRADESATLPIMMPSGGAFYVSVGASASNPETIVACGNLAPPSR
jgi:hypothetical protein